MRDESDTAVRPRPRLSKLSVLALVSTLPGLAFAAVVTGFLSRLLGPVIHPILMLYYHVVGFLVRTFWIEQPNHARNLTDGLTVPVLILSGALLEITLGLLSARRIDRSEGRLRGVSLSMAAIGVSMVSLLLAGPLMARQLKHVRDTARLSSIESSERQRREIILAIGAALKRYVDFHDGNLPEADKWCDLLIQGHYLDQQPQILWLASKYRWPCAINPDCGPDSPEETVMLFESRFAWNKHGQSELFVDGRGSNMKGYVILRDGRMEAMSFDSFRSLLWESRKRTE